MHDQPLLGSIVAWAGDYVPKGWALCHGQELAIADYPALYVILRERYGGDGVATFGLPRLRDVAQPGRPSPDPGSIDYIICTEGVFPEPEEEAEEAA